ncbi:MAG: hypothetical protein ACTS5I_03185, partial [Rhodanobacter sp.]
VRKFFEFRRVAARHENESGIVPRKLGEYPLEKLNIRAGEGCKAPFAVLVTALGLMKLSPALTDNHKLSLRQAWFFDANALSLALQDPDELINCPPEFVTVAELI